MKEPFALKYPRKGCPAKCAGKGCGHVRALSTNMCTHDREEAIRNTLKKTRYGTVERPAAIGVFHTQPAAGGSPWCPSSQQHPPARHDASNPCARTVGTCVCMEEGVVGLSLFGKSAYKHEHARTGTGTHLVGRGVRACVCADKQ